jgi:hypothetical protein
MTALLPTTNTRPPTPPPHPGWPPGHANGTTTQPPRHTNHATIRKPPTKTPRRDCKLRSITPTKTDQKKTKK